MIKVGIILSTIRLSYCRIFKGKQMEHREQPVIEEITWNDGRKLLRNGCQKLLDIIDEISPSKKLTLVRVRYPYGAIIAQNDSLYLPTHGIHTVSLHNSKTPKKWHDLLGYRSIPMGMIVENSVEIFREIDDKVFSVALSGPNTGMEIGIVEVFGSTAGYTITSGARSLYMIPRISKTIAHKKLRREFGITSPAPKNLIEHWHIFKELYYSPSFKKSWDSELLFLSRPWAQYLEKENDLAWLKLKCYIQKKAWAHSELGRRKVLLDIVWQMTASLLTTKGIKPDPYVVDTLRHLILISLGGISGSRPASNDNFAGPITEFQKIYLDVYGLTDQIPTMMRPYTLNLNENKPVYYSMQTPLLLSSTPNFRNMSSNIEDMRELIGIKNYIFDRDFGNLKIDNIRFSELLNRIQLSYFHGSMYAYGKEIRPTTEMPDSDPDMLYMPIKTSTHKFADNGAYIRGCIKISKK